MGIEKFIKRGINYSKFVYYEYLRKKLIKKLKKVKKIKLCFFGYALGGSCDIFSDLYHVFSRDSRFDVYVIIVPNTHGSNSEMIELLESAKNYLNDKNIPFISGYDTERNVFIDVRKTIDPDIVFMCHEYEWFPKEFKIENFIDKIVYTLFYGLSLLENTKDHINSTMFTFSHKTFLPTQACVEYACLVSEHSNKNIYYKTLGYPKLDHLFDNRLYGNFIWKHDNLKKIIWAPHHLYAPFSNFLEMKDYMVNLCSRYRDKVQIAFRPHPGLKDSLINVAGWTTEEVENYYNLWKTLPNGQISEGDFHDLFLSSDAMVLDSIGFIAEYAITNKPALFIDKRDTKIKFNPLGELLRKTTYICDNYIKVENFIEDIVLLENDFLKKRREDMISQVFGDYSIPSSEKIYNYVVTEIFEESRYGN